MAATRLSRTGLLPVAESNSAFRQVVWGKLDQHAVARHYPDVIRAHFARYMAQDFVPVLKLDVEQSVGQRVQDCAIHRYHVVAGAAWSYRRSRRIGVGLLGLRLLIMCLFLHSLSFFSFVGAQVGLRWAIK